MVVDKSEVWYLMEIIIYLIKHLVLVVIRNNGEFIVSFCYLIHQFSH